MRRILPRAAAGFLVLVGVGGCGAEQHEKAGPGTVSTGRPAKGTTVPPAALTTPSELTENAARSSGLLRDDVVQVTGPGTIIGAGGSVRPLIRVPRAAHAQRVQIELSGDCVASLHGQRRVTLRLIGRVVRPVIGVRLASGASYCEMTANMLVPGRPQTGSAYSVIVQRP